MEKTIAFKISQRDYFKFNVIHNTKLTGYYGIIIFILTLLERDKTYSLPVGIIIALLFTTIFMIIIWVATAIFLYFRSNSIYKQDKELSLPEELTFTEDYFEEKNERGYKQYYYTDIYKIKITKTLLIIYLAQVKAILIPASDEYDIQKLYLEIKEKKALHTEKKMISGVKTMTVKKLAIISLSRGLLGEPFIKHAEELGFKRLHSYGIEVVTTANACKGIDFLQSHPEARAQDLLDAFSDPSIDMILCAIGGDDTYKLLPYLFEYDELRKAVHHSKKIFLGFSDTTMNHFMLHNIGVNTFYGQSFVADICELEDEMLPYSKKYFEELITTGTIKEIRPSDMWYGERTAFDESQIGVKRVWHRNNGFELLQGKSVFSGAILGGCIETMYDMFDNTRHNDSPALCRRYHLFPSIDDWHGKILLLESSEERTKPELYQKMLQALKATGIFEVINGILVGKPMDEVYYEDYKRLLISEINKPDLPIVYNVNIGHATPRCIIPLGVEAMVDADEQVIRFA